MEPGSPQSSRERDAWNTQASRDLRGGTDRRCDRESAPQSQLCHHLDLSMEVSCLLPHSLPGVGNLELVGTGFIGRQWDRTELGSPGNRGGVSFSWKFQRTYVAFLARIRERLSCQSRTRYRLQWCFLKFNMYMNHLRILLKCTLGQSRDCISKKFPDDAGVAEKKRKKNALAKLPKSGICPRKISELRRRQSQSVNQFYLGPEYDQNWIKQQSWIKVLKGNKLALDACISLAFAIMAINL